MAGRMLMDCQRKRDSKLAASLHGREASQFVSSSEPALFDCEKISRA
jgi:hypothetical protein